MRAIVLLMAVASVALGQAPTSQSDMEKLEAKVAARPTDLGSRTLIVNYLRTPAVPVEKAIEARRRHILWFIRNVPDNGMLSTATLIILARNDRLADPEGYAQCAAAWREQLAKAQSKPDAYLNAAEFFKFSERDETQKIIAKGARAFPAFGRLKSLKGTLVAWDVTGATSFDQYGHPSGIPKNALQTNTSMQARKSLESEDDVSVLTGALDSLGAQYYELQKQDAEGGDELFHFAEGLMVRAHSKKPEDPMLQYAISSLYYSAAQLIPLAKDRARLLEKAAGFLTLPQQRARILNVMAEAHYDNRQYDAAALDAEEILKIKYDAGEAHNAYIVLGRVAIKREKLDEAKSRLLEAGRVTPSPMLAAIGPRFTLAQDLLEAGETETVLEYLTLSRKLWTRNTELVDYWSDTIRAGGAPDFRRRVMPSGAIAGKLAAGFRLKDLAGREHTLEQYKGKVVVLDFWATWCPPCRKELPSFEKLHRDWKGKDAVILAVNVGEAFETVSGYIEKEKFTLPVLLAQSSEMPGKYNVSAYPTLVIIDKEGRIADYQVGVRSENELRAAVDLGRAGAKPAAIPVAAGGAPEPVSPPDGSVFSHFPRTTQLAWMPVAGAAGYMVEWDYKDGDQWWSEVHGKQITKLTQETMHTIDHVGAQPGRWRVWAVLASGGVSPKSPWREFRYTR